MDGEKPTAESDFEQFAEALSEVTRSSWKTSGPGAEAAGLLFKIAIRRGDPTMLAVALSTFSTYVEQGKSPPLPMLRELAAAFDSWRVSGGTDAKSIGTAFGLASGGRGRRADSYIKWVHDQLAYDNVSRYLERFGGSLENAVSSVAESRMRRGIRYRGPRSESSIKQSYLRINRSKKTK